MNTGAAPALKIAKSQVITLSEAGISEASLEKLIADDPRLIGLGDLVLIERQRTQERAGRLDLLLEDRDGEVRFEVELMLGCLDESHLIRAIEYWDIERRHYPGYDHRAVIIAEDITSRFLNVIQLFSGSLPIIAIQVNCIKVDDRLALNFIKLLDSTTLRRDDVTEAKTKPTDRNDWLSYVGPAILSIADECVTLINAKATRKRSLNYNKQFIGLLDGSQANNFVYFKPRKSVMRVRVHLESAETWDKKLKQAGVDSEVKGEGLTISLTPQSLEQSKAAIAEVLQQAVKEDEA